MTNVRIDFPQYAAKVEVIGEPPNVTVAVSCPVCGKELTKRTWMGFEPSPSESWVEVENLPEGGLRVTDASSPDVRAAVEARLKDSRADREVFWAHLERTHLGEA